MSYVPLGKDVEAIAPEWLSPGGKWSQVAPDNVRLLDRGHKQFASWLTTYTPIGTLWRQHQLPGEVMPDGVERRWTHSVRWFVLHDNTAIGVTMNGTEPIYLQCGCNHSYVTERERMCYWEGTCSKCGYHNVIDSSD